MASKMTQAQEAIKALREEYKKELAVYEQLRKDLAAVRKEAKRIRIAEKEAYERVKTYRAIFRGEV